MSSCGTEKTTVFPNTAVPITNHKLLKNYPAKNASIFALLMR